MSERRHLWYFLASLALLIAPFGLTIRPVLAAGAYVVTSDADTGGDCVDPTNCTLRQAIESANHDNVNSSITFNFPGADPVTIRPLSALPTIDESGTTLTGQININNFKPRIIIDGNGSLPFGFSISNTASNTIIEKLIVTGFRGQGSAPFGVAIYVNGATGTTIRSSYIGNVPDVTYDPAYANRIGIYDSHGSATTIGGTSLTDRNTISGNTGDGVVFSDTTGGSVLNSYIGVAPGISQAFPLGNGGNGVQVESSNGVTVGGNPPNVISANTLSGILVTGSTANANTISTNYIGTDENGATHGSVSFSNGGDGVRVENGAKNTVLVGAGSAIPTLLISNNLGYGVRVTTRATGTQIGSALIGLAMGGMARLDNQLGGVVLLDDSTQTTVGPGNYISGNTGSGITLKLSSTSYTSVSSTTITGNYIGLNALRTGTIANTTYGIDVQASSNNTLIGGSAATANYIAGNTSTAITISGTGTVSTTVKYNTIGLAKDASTNYVVPAGNGGHGILISNGPQKTTIGNNIIGSNSGAGISVADASTTTVTLSQNRIGLVPVDNTILDRPNGSSGITLNTVKTVDVISNMLGYNNGSGILATDVQTVTLRSNQASLHSSGSGIEISGTSRNVQVLSNTLSLNGGYGILVQSGTQRVRMQYNRISGNTGGGVRLNNTSISNGSAPDEATTLPNHGIDPPIFDVANIHPLRMRIDQNGVFSGWVYTNTTSLPASACYPANLCQIQFFRSGDVADGQGFTAYKVASVDGGTTSDFAYPNAQGFFTGRLALSDADVLPAQLIFAITDADGNTSEFGQLSVTPALNMTYLTTVDGKQNAVPNQTIAYTMLLVNNGTVDLTNLNVVTHNTLARWGINPSNELSNLLSIPAHSSKVVTVTLTLPTGTDSNALSGTQDKTLITAAASGRLQNSINKQLTITTTVLASPVVNTTTLVGAGSAPPGGHVTHTHRFTNLGNHTVTLDLTSRTIDPADSDYVWNTVLDTYALEIPPGGQATVNATITVPLGAQVNDAAGNLMRVTTVITGTARSPFGTIVNVVSGTTGVDLVPRVQMTGNGQIKQAASSAEVSFFHNVLNTSNGPARFCLNYRANSGSTVVSFISQNGVAINTSKLGSCFVLDAPNGAAPLLRFMVVIKVTNVLLPGDLESVDIYLTNADTGQTIPNALVTNNIQITSSPVLPRLWIPVAIRQ